MVTQQASRRRLQVVVFAGGRGAATIIDALARHPQVDVTVIVNAYDDGLSTGRVRRLVPGMLGPSDVRKNIATLMPSTERCHLALGRLLDYRFPPKVGRERARSAIAALANGRFGDDPDELALDHDALTVRQAEAIGRFGKAFLAHEARALRRGEAFEWGDCSVGNVLFTGCCLAERRDFNRTVAAFSTLCEVRGRVLNVTDGANRVLTGLRTDGSYLADEASIVAPQPEGAAIEEIFLLPNYLTDNERDELDALSAEQRCHWLRSRESHPEPNPEALEAIRAADVIVYGPGTQHSSLFPSYLTRGVAEAVASNEAAEKPFVANIVYDHDIRQLSVGGLLDAFLWHMGRKGEAGFAQADLMSRVFVQAADDGNLNKPWAASYVGFDAKALADRATVTAMDWEAADGKHVGGRIVDEILGLVLRVVDIRLQPFRHMVSIVVPALNEFETVGAVLSQLGRLDFSRWGMSKEVILVDGGSNDGTLDVARDAEATRVYSAERSGRGAALRTGIDKARGNVVVFFPSDGEYDPDDVYAVAEPVIENQYEVVYGSRAIKCVNVEERLLHIYEGNRLAYLTSKYGGMSLSILSLLLFNRFVSDPFSTLKAFDGSFLKSLELQADGLELEAELIARIGKRRAFILEVPVSYRPRTKDAGKKTTVRDGLRTLATLVREAVGRPPDT